ncbi:Zinc finger protein RFP [Varanus komodoensis]|nr:Zinc finger protein RFP [Varanus komodoensis]
MAADPLLQEFVYETTCPLCLEPFKVPVMVDCGDNFCQDCLIQFWEETSADSSCPQCRAAVRYRSFMPNWKLAKFVELVKRLQEDKYRKDESRECAVQQEPLKVVCEEGQALIYVSSDKSKEHQDHSSVPTEEASQETKTRKKLQSLEGRKFCPDKTEVLLVGGSNSWVGDLDLVLNGVALPLKDRVRSLGVLLDPEQTLEAQVLAVVRSAFHQLRLIHQLRPYLEDDCLATVMHALVTSRLDFCNTLYVGLPLKTVRILQMVQNRAARLLMGTGRCSHITPVLYQLHWLPVDVWAQFKVLVITYKALTAWDLDT